MLSNIYDRNLRKIKIAKDGDRQTFCAYALPMTIKKERTFAQAVQDIIDQPDILKSFAEQFVLKQIIWWDLLRNGKRLPININNYMSHLSTKQRLELIDAILPKTKAQREKYTHRFANMLHHIFNGEDFTDCPECQKELVLEGGITVKRTVQPNCSSCNLKETNKLDSFVLRDVLTTLQFNIWPRTGGLDNQEPDFLEKVILAKNLLKQFSKQGVKHATT